MDEKKALTRRQKEKKNKQQLAYYNGAFRDAVSKSDFEKNIDCISFLQNINSGNEQCKTELQYLAAISILGEYIRLLNYSLKEKLKSESSEESSESELDTSKLYAWQIIKNFSELCRLVGIKPPSNNRQKEQYKNKFHRFFDFAEMDFSDNIIILEIYDKPLQRTQKYSGKFIREIQLLILNMLISVAQQNPDALDEDGYMEYVTTYSRLLHKDLHLINSDFNKKIGNKYVFNSFFEEKYSDYFSERNSVEFNLITLYNRILQKYKGGVTTALQKLSGVEEMITFQKYHIAKKQEENENYKWVEIHSQKEETYIKNTRKVIAESMGYKNSMDCYNHGDGKAFEEKFNSKILQEKGWLEIRYRIKIGFNINHILSYVWEYQDVESYRAVLNRNMEEALNQQAIEQYQKDFEQYQSEKEKFIEAIKTGEIDCLYGDAAEMEKQFDSKSTTYKKRYQQEYPESQRIITSYVVNPDLEMKDELNQFKKSMRKQATINIMENQIDLGLYEDEEALFIDSLDDEIV